MSRAKGRDASRGGAHVMCSASSAPGAGGRGARAAREEKAAPQSRDWRAHVTGATHAAPGESHVCRASDHVNI